MRRDGSSLTQDVVGEYVRKEGRSQPIAIRLLDHNGPLESGPTLSGGVDGTRTQFMPL
jgi:hypothetical protein